MGLPSFMLQLGNAGLAGTVGHRSGHGLGNTLIERTGDDVVLV